eukprot:11382802-Heterocapsa_arctica.AAC.1
MKKENKVVPGLLPERAAPEAGLLSERTEPCRGRHREPPQPATVKGVFMNNGLLMKAKTGTQRQAPGASSARARPACAWSGGVQDHSYLLMAPGHG